MARDNARRLRKASQQHAYASLQMHEAVARKAGFAGTDHKYLGFFLQNDRLTAGEVAGLTGLTTGAVTGLIDRFEKKGLLRRAFDENDRRRIIVIPDAPKITALLEPFYKEFQEETDRLIESYSDEEIQVIASYLSKSMELIKKTHEKLNT